jgi:hypothetical protein
MAANIDILTDKNIAIKLKRLHNEYWDVSRNHSRTGDINERRNQDFEKKLDTVFFIPSPQSEKNKGGFQYQANDEYVVKMESQGPHLSPPRGSLPAGLI